MRVTERRHRDGEDDCGLQPQAEDNRDDAAALVSIDRRGPVGEGEDQRGELSLQLTLRQERELMGNQKIDAARDVCVANRSQSFRIRSILKEALHLDAQNPGNVMQSAGADPVGPLFVFLQLLERQAKL